MTRDADRKETAVTRIGIASLICLLLIAGCGRPDKPGKHSRKSRHAQTQPASMPAIPPAQPLPADLVDEFDLRDFPEPSGLVFHPARQTLFVVGDEGDLAEIATDGTTVNRAENPRRGDYEGVAVDPATGLLYVAQEGAETIHEVDPNSFAFLRSFQIQRRLGEQLILKYGNQGIEGVAYVPDPNHADGGTFFVVNQQFKLKDPEDLSAVVQVAAPLRQKTEGSSIVPILRFVQMPITDLADAAYDPASGCLLIVSDENDLLLKMTPYGQVAAAWTLPGRDQEGIALDDRSHLYIAQDTGGILKLKLRKPL